MHEMNANQQQMAQNMNALKLMLKRVDRRTRASAAGRAVEEEDDGEDKDNICNYIPCSSVHECQTLNAKLGSDPDLFKEAVSKIVKVTLDSTTPDARVRNDMLRYRWISSLSSKTRPVHCWPRSFVRH